MTWTIPCVGMHLLFHPLGSLKDRHIENGSELYAIFTPKENLKQAPIMPRQEMTDISGEENVRCHVMLKVNSSCYSKILSSNWQDSIYVYIYSCLAVCKTVILTPYFSKPVCIMKGCNTRGVYYDAG